MNLVSPSDWRGNDSVSLSRAHQKMKFRYDIFPEKRLIVQRYAGEISMQDFIICSELMWSDPKYSTGYNGIADLTQSVLKMNLLELPSLATRILGIGCVSKGRWVVLASTPVVTALAFLFQQTIQAHHSLEVFSTWEAACSFLGVEQAPEL